MGNIFELHSRVMEDYRDFVSSFINIEDKRAREFVEKYLDDKKHLWPEPLIQLSPKYKLGPTVDELKEQGLLSKETAEIFRNEQGEPFRLYQHQLEALEKAKRDESYVVTSGTGSGKSLTYFLPIIEYILNQPEAKGRVTALIVYPMNALVNSQLQSLQTLSENYRKRTGRDFPIKFGKYTGETKEEERQKMQGDPPHILLTNYVMAELMLVRQSEDIFLKKDKGGIRFFVFDELHTYRGRQGADVAMLVRRLKERSAAENIVHIGTSATMVSAPKATAQERRQAVADFASLFFGHPFTEQQIIEETLEPFTTGEPPADSELRTALNEKFPSNADEFRRHPLARWIEFNLGIEKDDAGNLRRKKPKTLAAAAEELSTQTGAELDVCMAKLKEMLTYTGSADDKAEDKAFAFKLHQFISQGHSLYATLENQNERTFSLEGQVRDESGRLNIPMLFCRICGQDYYHVLAFDDERFEPYPSGIYVTKEDKKQGYLMLAPEINDWSEALVPDEWLDQNGRLNNTWKNRVPRAIWVKPNGKFSPEPFEGAIKFWYQKENFHLCLNCGEFYDARVKDFNKFTSLSTEGRSSATTILAVSMLRHAARTGAARDKLLSFTDNRQDASLQAGHFNDFVHSSVLRSALLAALNNSPSGQLDYANIPTEVVNHYGLELKDFARTPDIDPDSSAAKNIWQVFQDLVEYRIFEDLQRGWSVMQPNLEQLGLLKIDYLGLKELCQKDSNWEFNEVLKNFTAKEREELIRPILDEFRRKLAINAPCLTEDHQNRLKRKAEQALNEFWGIDSNEILTVAGSFTFDRTQYTRKTNVRSLNAQSKIGRYIASTLKCQADEYRHIAESILDLLIKNALIEKKFNKRGKNSGFDEYRLCAAALIWKKADGNEPFSDPLYNRRSYNPNYSAPDVRPNKFFQRFYQEMTDGLSSLEAREHTAQVVTPGERENRERRFRWNENDRKGDAQRRLPYLVCSPTMELGIDISDLEMIHLRNVPPTPANYAQRSGRAGRQGQPGLVITYCGARSNHDQYFFRHREEMVAGSVRAPRLELTNDALLRAHIHAMWLAKVGVSLGNSINELLDLERDEYPLKDNIAEQIKLKTKPQEDLIRSVKAALNIDENRISEIVNEAAENFNRSFDRWRELYRFADTQRNEAADELKQNIDRDAQQKADKRLREARRQIDLLFQQNVAREEGDFYPYRYLATEGFLPGYNFPKLPLRAWVSRGDGEFISRARSIALKEFAPENIIYHEGSRWKVDSFRATLDQLENLRYKRIICNECGAFNNEENDVCESCRTRFEGGNYNLVSLLTMTNVSTVRRDRITSNEEERRRLGYKIDISYQFSPTADGQNKIEADVVVDGEPLLRMIYAPAATLLGINSGFREDNNRGFLVNFANGRIERVNGATRVFLAVQDTQNILLIKFLNEDIQNDKEFTPSMQYALQRGIEQAFGIDESEISSMMLGKGANLSLLYYEASEGGCGVLESLMYEVNAIGLVAKEALLRCHFNEKGEDLYPHCEVACYECLLSFTNQTNAMLINRRKISEFLLSLTNGKAQVRTGGRSYKEQIAWLRERVDKNSELEIKFLKALESLGAHLPDRAQQKIANPNCVADFYYERNKVCIFCDGTVHNSPGQKERDKTIRDELMKKGYRVVVIRYDAKCEELIRERKDIFGV